VVEHHRGGQQQGGRVRDALAGDVGRRAVHRLEDGRIGADVGTRGHAQAADQAGHQVGQDVAEQVGGDYHVESLRPLHEVRREDVDVVLVHLNVRIVLRHQRDTLVGRLLEDYQIELPELYRDSMNRRAPIGGDIECCFRRRSEHLRTDH